MPGPPAQPTESQVYDLYQSLLDAINHAILTTPDAGLRHILQPLSQTLTDLLDDDDIAALHANTALFSALTPDMKTANDALKAAQTHIAAVAGKVADAGNVLSALTKVLTATAKFV